MCKRWVRKLEHAVILELKNGNFTAIIFLKDLDNDEILISNKISSREKKYKYFIGYMDDNYKIKLLHIMLPKTCAYLKSYDGELNGCIF